MNVKNLISRQILLYTEEQHKMKVLITLQASYQEDIRINRYNSAYQNEN